MSQQTVEGLALEKQMLEVLAKFTEEERRHIFEVIGERFCLHCGSESTVKDPVCHCRNDE